MKHRTIQRLFYAILGILALRAAPALAETRYGIWAKVTQSELPMVKNGDQAFMILDFKNQILEENCEFGLQSFNCQQVADSVEAYIYPPNHFFQYTVGFKVLGSHIEENVNDCSVSNAVPNFTRGYSFRFNGTQFLKPASWQGGGIMSASVFLNMTSTAFFDDINVIEPNQILDPDTDFIENPSEIVFIFNKSVSNKAITAEVISAFKLP